MRDALPILLLLIVAAFLSACQSNATQTTNPSDLDAQATPDTNDKPVAYLDGKPVTQSQVYRLIAPAHGGDALAEILLDRSVKARLNQEGIELTTDQIDAERDKLLASLDQDPDQAARLLKTMRAERGLDKKRFDAMLRRNAGLRRLVRDQVSITDAAIGQAYERQYGTRYQVRLIVADQLDDLARVRREVLKGQSFTDLAIKISTDVSASQGGLLSPISPVDPTYPKAIRDALPKLSLDTTDSRLSNPIALDSGYALLWLEEIIHEHGPPMAQVRDELAAAVRAELERLRMRQLARTLIEQADVVVLDPALDKAWRRQSGSSTGP